MKKIVNALCALGIAANTAMIALNLFEFNNVHAALFNFASALLCWVGYFRTNEDGN